MITIPEGTTFIGEMRSKGRMRFNGRMEGSADVNGSIIVGKPCVWVGRICADVVIVEGRVEGDIVARQKLELRHDAYVLGHIKSPNIAISEGARLHGDVDMAPPRPIGLIENLGANKPEQPQSTEEVKPRLAGQA